MSRLLILTYHRVLDRPDPLMPGHVDLKTFRRQVEVLRRWFRVWPLREAVRKLKRAQLPPRAVVITFDDGYADNYTNALPVLASAGLTATFFIATGYLNGQCMWNDAVVEAVRCSQKPQWELGWLGLGSRELGDIQNRARLFADLIRLLKYVPMDERLGLVDKLLIEADTPRPSQLMMTPAQVREMAAAGMEIGAHTRHHPILSRVSPEIARDEIRSSRDELQRLLSLPVSSFAYPNGKPVRDYTTEHVDIVREAGFEIAVSTALGAARHDDDIFQLPRVGLWSAAPWKIVSNLALTLGSKRAERASA